MGPYNCVIPGCQSQNRRRGASTSHTIFTIQHYERRPQLKECHRRLLQCLKDYVGLSPKILLRLRKGLIGICGLHFRDEDVYRCEC